MKPRSLLRLGLAGAVATGGMMLAWLPADASQAHKQRTVPVRLLALNDFHGHLEPPTGSSGRMVDEPGATADAGGAEHEATHMKAPADRNTSALAEGDL